MNETLLDAARTSLLCGRQLRLSSINVMALTEHDDGFLVGRSVAPRPSNEYVGLGLN